MQIWQGAGTLESPYGISEIGKIRTMWFESGEIQAGIQPSGQRTARRGDVNGTPSQVTTTREHLFFILDFFEGIFTGKPEIDVDLAQRKLIEFKMLFKC